MEEHEWELVKENVQPLRHGRTMSSLTKGLHSDPTDENFIKENQRAFELELRTYEGDDPLDVWYRYIKWTEQHFPKGGQDGHLRALIEKCLVKFQAEERYANDTRFIKLWIMFSNFSDSPTDVFAYMFDKGIGDKVSQLYIDWATVLELAGNAKRADGIYTEGLNRLAEPRDLLLQKQQQFQHRLAKNITLQMADHSTSGLELEEEEKREALSRLKPVGAKHKVGTTRTGAVNMGSAGCLKDQRGALAPKQVPTKGFTFYTDENAPQQPQQTKEWHSMPSRSVDTKENESKPGVWTSAKLRQSHVAREATTSSSGENGFSIHEDPVAPATETPMKTSLMNHKPLSVVKAQEQNDVLSSVRQGQGVPNNGVPMYRKDKVYQGIQEFSFEELKAIQYWKSVEAAQKEAERLRLEEERQKREVLLKAQVEAQANRLENQASELNTQAKILEDQASKLAMFEVMLQSHLSNLNIQPNPETGQAAEGQSQSEQSSEQMSQALSSLPGQAVAEQRSQSSENQALPIQASSSSSLLSSNTKRSAVSARQGQFNQKMKEAVVGSEVNASSDFITPTNLSGVCPGKPSSSGSAGYQSSGSQRTPIFNSLSTYSSLVSSSGSNSIKNFLQHNSSNSVAVRQQVRDSSSSLNQSSRSTPSGLTDEVHPLNGRGNRNKMPISAPSPTVCTKEAVQLVRGMFCVELDEESIMEEGTTDTDLTNPRQGLPFNICEDKTDHRIPVIGGASEFPSQTQHISKATPIAIYQDNDGQPPTKVAAYQDENDAPVASSGPAPTLASGFEIFQDEKVAIIDSSGMVPVKKENCKFGARLSFPAMDDVDMTDMERGEVQDFTIAHAREDMTIGPLTNFSIKACTASTPFNGSYNNKSHKAVESMESEVSLPSCSDTTAQTVEGDALSSSRHLSPILEGSGEGSSNDTNAKSLSHVTADSAMSAKKLNVPTAAFPIQVIQEKPNESLDDDDVSVCDDQPLDATCHHIIDTSACLPEDTEALLSTSVSIHTRDPFDKEGIHEYLSRLEPPLSSYDNYHELDDDVVEVCENDIISVGENLEMLAVDNCLGKGGYAQVFKMYKQTLEDIDNQDFEAMKVQKPPCYWEFYIACEMQKRLAALRGPMDVRPSVMSVNYGYFNNDMSILVMKLMEHGSLLNVVNLYKNDIKLMSQIEPFVCLVTVELLHLFEQLHKCHIIHGDVKPDNFLLMELPVVNEGDNPRDVFGSSLRVFCLTDFGQSIDMHMFPRGTTFRTKVNTSGFECIEMRTDRPWTFQADLFGLAGTLHVLLFGSYMKVFVEKGVWKTTGNFVRKWNVPLWKKLFHQLLNIPSCDCLPDLSALRAEFEDYFCSNLVHPYNCWVRSVQILLNREGSLTNTKI